MRTLLILACLLFQTEGRAASDFPSAAVKEGDTTQRQWHPRSPQDRHIADSLSSLLLSDSLVFRECWNNNVLFPYPRKSEIAFPDTLSIPLVKNGEEFVLTWYGAINSRYGYRDSRIHQGLDLHLRKGDTVVAAFDGIVRYTGYNAGGYGKCVVIRHLNGLETLYGHLDGISVWPNQFLRAGECIGLGGTTGRSTGPHLHFEMRYKDVSFDPLLVFDPATLTLRRDTLTMTREAFLNEKKTAVPPGKKETRQPVAKTEKPKTVGKTQSVKSNKESSGKSTKTNPRAGKGSSDGKSSQDAKGKKVSTSQSVGKGKTAPTKNTARTHVVKKGESLSTIARLYGVSIEKLQKTNGLKPGALLQTGQKLTVK